MKNPSNDKPEKYAASMREKAMSIAMKRKEDYLGARVSKALKDKVIKQAEEMQIPVSLLIRRVLEEAFGEGSNAVNSLQTKKNMQSTENKSEKTDKYADIIGWKSIEVNQDRSCERCREPLPKGTEAALGFTASDSSYVIVCHQCKSQLINNQ